MPALSNPVGANYPLNGVTDAQHPVLGGTVLQDKLDTLQFAPANPGLVGEVGQLQSRIVHSTQSGKLDLYWRITNTGSKPFHLQTAGIYKLAAVRNLILTFADFRTDGVGTIAPTHFLSGPPPSGSKAPADRMFYFLFNQTIPPGASTRFFFLSTNATAFTQGSIDFSFATGDPHNPGLEVVIAGPTAP